MSYRKVGFLLLGIAAVPFIVWAVWPPNPDLVRDQRLWERRFADYQRHRVLFSKVLKEVNKDLFYPLKPDETGWYRATNFPEVHGGSGMGYENIAVLVGPDGLIESYDVSTFYRYSWSGGF